ncbi:C40 family peptidase [Streptomyces sp. TLI_105]|uniref:C40 family peptidase n=1 Tax=Streptomyces sp. TLI_105 TaxID=1881019 RepID=UPI00089C367F|nr:C40 family peptidase [Streptomyces sp. TLI_105]SEC50005.1 Cell wall-associated hydrolase, NlpC family [Streptomyces sp. TLI_105]
MSRRLLRTVCTGALAVATALTGMLPGAAAAPDPPVDPPAEAPIAWADPAAEPVGPVDPATPAATGTGTGTGTDAAAGTDPVPGTGPSTGPGADPADPALPSPSPTAPSSPTASPPVEDDAAALPAPGGSSVSGLLTRLRTLYQQAEAATERYNAAEEALKRQAADTKKVTARLTAARTALAQGRAAAGRIARDQYQGRSDSSPFPSYLRLLFAADPQSALDEGHLMARAARDRATAVSRLTRAERQAGSLASASRKALDRQQGLVATQRTRRDEVRAKLLEVEKLLAALSPDQLARITALERVQTAGAQSQLLGSGVLDGPRTPSRAGAEALRFAVEQIGKPYEWGAEGPEAYDCSGLTQQAWAAAGRELPRTSQEQWESLPRVPLTELRPGDLVVYFPGATHVALYLGEGLVVQAPRPGGKVKVSPLAANPVLGAVRPDPGGTALERYTPPELPAGAGDGGDEGYDRD